VNAETTNLIERPYQEIVDDVLTAIVGGVVNEPIIFDVKFTVYELAKRARAVRGITGVIDDDSPDGVRHTFQTEIDFHFDSVKSAVVWNDDGRKPRDNTRFYVDYFPTNIQPPAPLSDINIGSVTRTLSEAIGREIATLYQQVNLAYKSGFIDLAEGKSLDFVVAILGITRKTKEFANGPVTFFRKPGSDGNITIAQGTQVATAKNEVVFETTDVRTLQRGQARIDVTVRAGEKFKGDVGKVDAGKITSLFQIIEGIERVNNFEPTFLAAEDESDIELRLRAKAALQSLSKGTIAALLRTVAENRAKVIQLFDPNSPGGKESQPGKVLMLVETEAPRFPSLKAALNDVRAAGVQLTVTAKFVFVTIRIVCRITPGLTGEGKTKISTEIIAELQKYFETLGAGEVAEGSKMLEAIKKVADVDKKEISIADVKTSKSDIGQADADPLVEALVASVGDVNPNDVAALRTSFKKVIDEEATALAPSERREPDRSLVKSLDKTARANPGDLATGKFVILPPAEFSLVLEMETTDIILRES